MNEFQPSDPFSSKSFLELLVLAEEMGLGNKINLGENWLRENIKEEALIAAIEVKRVKGIKIGNLVAIRDYQRVCRVLKNL